MQLAWRKACSGGELPRMLGPSGGPGSSLILPGTLAVCGHLERACHCIGRLRTVYRKSGLREGEGDGISVHSEVLKPLRQQCAHRQLSRRCGALRRITGERSQPAERRWLQKQRGCHDRAAVAVKSVARVEPPCSRYRRRAGGVTAARHHEETRYEHAECPVAHRVISCPTDQAPPETDAAGQAPTWLSRSRRASI